MQGDALENVVCKMAVILPQPQYVCMINAELILGLRPSNERLRYKVSPFLIDWVQT